MIEEWKPVVGYPSHYISNYGVIRREAGLTYGSLCNGYRQHRAANKGSKFRKYVHHMVMEAFVGPRPEGWYVNHKDGVKFNNRLDNLEYLSPTENSRHAVSTGLAKSGERSPQSKLAHADVLNIRQLKGRFTYEEIGEVYGITKGQVCRIMLGHQWRHPNF